MPNLLYSSLDALHLSIPAQGLPNGDAALQHAAYPGMQPYPGVGEFETLSQHSPLFKYSMLSIYIEFLVKIHIVLWIFPISFSVLFSHFNLIN